MTTWTALMLLTGVGAIVGHTLSQGMSPAMLALMQGFGAGAMLTMISETMLPEAYIKGGSVIGLATLLGFLSAMCLTETPSDPEQPSQTPSTSATAHEHLPFPQQRAHLRASQGVR